MKHKFEKIEYPEYEYAIQCSNCGMIEELYDDEMELEIEDISYLIEYSSIATCEEYIMQKVLNGS